MWDQILAVTMLNLRSVPRRLGSSAVAVLGIAGVVLVLTGVLSIREGFRQVMTAGGDPLTAVVLRDGAGSETASILGHDSVRIIKDAPGIARRGNSPRASAELVTVVSHRRREGGKERNITLRGVEPAAFDVREELQVVEGQSFQTGQQEVILGRAVARHLGDLGVGRTVQWGGVSWTVVGILEAGGGSVESEVWCDVGILQQTFRRQNLFQAVYAKLESSGSLEVLTDALASDPRLEVDVKRENDYYAEQSRSLSGLITTGGTFVAILMGAAAMFGAVNTMYTAVAARTREIAILRAIGFGGIAIVCSVLAEAAALAFAGGALGTFAAWATFDGYAVSTLNFQSLSQVAFAFAVTPALLLQGVTYAVIIGLFGALLPAWKAARLEVAAALRA